VLTYFYTRQNTINPIYNFSKETTLTLFYVNGVFLPDIQQQSSHLVVLKYNKLCLLEASLLADKIATDYQRQLVRFFPSQAIML
jgi:hypothetical protein